MGAPVSKGEGGGRWWGGVIPALYPAVMPVYAPQQGIWVRCRRHPCSGSRRLSERRGGRKEGRGRGSGGHRSG